MILRKEIGFIAACLYAIYPHAVFYSGLTLMACTLTLISTLAVYLFFLGIKKTNTQFLLFSGLMFGIAAIGRGNIIFVVIVLGIFMLLKLKRTLPQLCHFAGCVLIPIFCLTIVNIISGHEFILTTYNLGLNFYVGHNPDADGTYQNPGGLSLYDDMDGIRTLSALTGRRVKKAESSGYWFREGIRYIKSYPWRTIILTLKKLYLFWGPREIQQTENFYYASQRSFLRFIPIGFWLFSPLYFSLFILMRRKYILPLIAIPLSYSISFLPFFITGRYRQPIVPIVILCAAAMVYYTYIDLRNRRYRYLQVSLSLIVLFAGLFIIQHKDIKKSILDTKSYYALYLKQKNMWGEAEDSLKSIINEDPQFTAGWLNLGVLYAHKHNFIEAKKIFTHVLQLEPQNAKAMMDLGASYMGLGSLDSALFYLKMSRERLPFSLEANYMIWQTMELKKIKATNEDSFKRIISRIQPR